MTCALRVTLDHPSTHPLLTTPPAIKTMRAGEDEAVLRHVPVCVASPWTETCLLSVWPDNVLFSSCLRDALVEAVEAAAAAAEAAGCSGEPIKSSRESRSAEMGVPDCALNSRRSQQICLFVLRRSWRCSWERSVFLMSITFIHNRYGSTILCMNSSCLPVNYWK